MPTLIPIRAIRYADAASDVSARISPPYDVLDEAPKQTLLKRDPHNVVAIDLPVTPPKTLGPDEAYNKAGDLFRAWIEKGVLQQDDEPAVFAYEQIYKVGDTIFRRRGLLSGFAVEPFGRANGGIHRHELTIKGGTDDRLKLMQATRAQLSPVFGMFSDPDAVVVRLLTQYFDEREPDFFGTTPQDNVAHRCWAVRDPDVLQTLTEFFAPVDVFIADGHHRYTTALNYHNERGADDVPSASCLMFVAALQDPGMIVLPTHRVLCGMRDFSMSRFMEIVTRDNKLVIEPAAPNETDLSTLEAKLPHSPHHAMGLYDPADKQAYILRSVSDDPLSGVLPEKPEVWRKLDVAILEHLIVERLLRPNFGADISYKYPHDLSLLPTLCAQSAADESRLGVIMQPTPLQSVCDVSLAGEVMPPKSTFFYPKLATGLVINPLW